MLYGEAVAGDQVKSHELQHTVLYLGRVELADAPGSQATWMDIGLIQLAVELLEVGPADHALTAHLQRLHIRNGQRYIEHDSDRVCHILADTTLSAPGDGLLQLAVLVAQHEREPVELPRNQRRVAADKSDDLIDGLCLCRRQHGAGVLDLRKPFQYFAGDLLRRGAGKHNAGVILQHLQLVKERIVFPIGHDWVVMFVVGGVGALENADKLFHARDACFICLFHSGHSFFDQIGMIERFVLL